MPGRSSSRCSDSGTWRKQALALTTLDELPAVDQAIRLAGRGGLLDLGDLLLKARHRTTVASQPSIISYLATRLTRIAKPPRRRLRARAASATKATILRRCRTGNAERPREHAAQQVHSRPPASRRHGGLHGAGTARVGRVVVVGGGHQCAELRVCFVGRTEHTPA